jgi:hypothetical protein
MKHKPSERCEDCFWWHEDPVLCEGCPNNPETEERRKTDLEGT